jgi:UDP-N-acetylmuramyl pentapeptide synthase
MDVLEVTYPSGDRVEREFTPEELAQREADLAAAEAAAIEAAALAEQNAQATAAAIAHAKSLGFTDEMIAVMYPNLGAQA